MYIVLNVKNVGGFVLLLDPTDVKFHCILPAVTL